MGFLDGREGLLLHLYHANYVSWKYAKAWERSRNSETLEIADLQVGRSLLAGPEDMLLARTMRDGVYPNVVSAHAWS